MYTKLSSTSLLKNIFNIKAIIINLSEFSHFLLTMMKITLFILIAHASYIVEWNDIENYYMMYTKWWINGLRGEFIMNFLWCLKRRKIVADVVTYHYFYDVKKLLMFMRTQFHYNLISFLFFYKVGERGRVKV